MRDVQTLLAPGSPDEVEQSERTDAEMVPLWDPKAGVLPAGVNYAHEPD
ncbi:hypothetical protein AB0I22_36160 [Streptomyces sp. NPDC050610]